MLSLRSRFHDGPGGLLAHSSGTNIPITALGAYMQRNHMAIQTDKEFNLHTQRQMILVHRMNEIVKKISEWLGEEIAELTQTLTEGNQRDGVGVALRDLLRSGLGIIFHFCSSRISEADRLEQDRLASGTAGFSQVVPNYEEYLGDFRRSVFERLKQVYVEYFHRLRSSYQEAYSAELIACTSLRFVISGTVSFCSA